MMHASASTGGKPPVNICNRCMWHIGENTENEGKSLRCSHSERASLTPCAC